MLDGSSVPCLADTIRNSMDNVVLVCLGVIFSYALDVRDNWLCVSFEWLFLGISGTILRANNFFILCSF